MLDTFVFSQTIASLIQISYIPFAVFISFSSTTEIPRRTPHFACLLFPIIRIIKTHYIHAEVVLHCLSACNKFSGETSIWE